MTSAEPKFFIKVVTSEFEGPKTWLASGLKALLDFASQWKEQIDRVFLIADDEAGGEGPAFVQLMEIREVGDASTVPFFVYRRKDGRWSCLYALPRREVDMHSVELARVLLSVSDLGATQTFEDK